MQEKEKGSVILSGRLHSVANMISHSKVTADVGCDHGFVSIYLIHQQISERVIAMDINEGPLKRAEEHISERNLSNYIELRQSDGMQALRDSEADAMIIAGIGGRLMIRILNDGMDKLKNMEEVVLQPQSEIAKVRHFLAKQHFRIVKEDMVLDEGKYYQIIKTKYDDKETVLSEEEEWYGPVLLEKKHPLLQQYLLGEKEKFLEIAKQIDNQAQDTIKRKDSDSSVKERLRIIEQALGRYSLL